MMCLMKFFECGNIFGREDAVDLKVTKFSDIEQKILPFFEKYPILVRSAERGARSSKIERFLRFI
jgi:hypothetical protein